MQLRNDCLSQNFVPCSSFCAKEKDAGKSQKEKRYFADKDHPLFCEMELISCYSIDNFTRLCALY